MTVDFRRHMLPPLGYRPYAPQPSIPRLARSAPHRCLQPAGHLVLNKYRGRKPKRQKFQRYPIGSFHVDLAAAQIAEGKIYRKRGVAPFLMYLTVPAAVVQTQVYCGGELMMSDGFAGRHEVLSDRGSGRRTWSDETKLRIVAESPAPGAMVSEVSRRYHLMPSQVTTRRRLYYEGELGPVPSVTPPAFAPLVMAEPKVAPARPGPDAKNGEFGRIAIQVGVDMVIRLPRCTPAVRIAGIASALWARSA